MYGTGEGIDAANVLGVRVDSATFRKHRLKRCTYGGYAHDAGPTRVHANDVILVGPAGHQSVQVASLKGVIKHGLQVIGFAAVQGGVFTGFWHGEKVESNMCILPRLLRRPCVSPIRRHVCFGHCSSGGMV
jgi:hypothetical protein